MRTTTAKRRNVKNLSAASAERDNAVKQCRNRQKSLEAVLHVSSTGTCNYVKHAPYSLSRTTFFTILEDPLNENEQQQPKK